MRALLVREALLRSPRSQAHQRVPTVKPVSPGFRMRVLRFGLGLSVHAMQEPPRSYSCISLCAHAMSKL